MHIDGLNGLCSHHSGSNKWEWLELHQTIDKNTIGKNLEFRIYTDGTMYVDSAVLQIEDHIIRNELLNNQFSEWGSYNAPPRQTRIWSSIHKKYFRL